MIKEVNITDFIEKYEGFYFRDNKKTDTDKEIYGVPKNLNVTASEIENKITKYLNKGEVNATVTAWKAGRLNDDLTIHCSQNGNYLNGYGKEIDKEQLDNYLMSFDKTKKEKICELIEKHQLEKAFVVTRDLGKEIVAPDNFGSVYIINLMFFISRGTVPIYDKFAHKALRALLEGDVAPSKIYLSDAPQKSDEKQVIIMYEEYIRLIKKVFGTDALRESCKNYENREMLVSRELDRALWVYGHTDKPYIR